MTRERRSHAAGLWALLIASAIQGLTPDARSLASPWGLDRLDELAVAAGSADPGAARFPGTLPSGHPDRDEAPTAFTMAGVPDRVPAIGRRRASVPPVGLLPTREGGRPIADPRRSTGIASRLIPHARGPALSGLCRLTC